MALRPAIPGLSSLADQLDDGRLHATSAERNAAGILEMLLEVAPRRGSALELAAGTGQHAVAFSTALPGLDWQPTDMDPERLVSIEAWRQASGPASLRAPIPLDACVPGWAQTHGGRDLVLLVNLLHLITTAEARVLVDEAARALRPGGRFVLYGPFLRDGVATSEGDRQFHAGLQATDPETGYKNDADIRNWLAEAGLSLVESREMPANNLCFVGERISV